MDQRPAGAPVAVLERVDGLELQMRDGGEQQRMLSRAVQPVQEILDEGGDQARRRGDIVGSEPVPPADPHVDGSQPLGGSDHAEGTMDLLDVVEAPEASLCELLDGGARRLDVAGHAQRLVIAQVILRFPELGIGDIAPRGGDPLDPGGGDGLRAEEDGVYPCSSRLIDLRRGGGDEARGLQRLLADLSVEERANVLTGELRRHEVGEDAPSPGGGGGATVVGRLVAFQPRAVDTHIPSSVNFMNLRLTEADPG